MYRSPHELKKFTVNLNTALREAVRVMDEGHYGFIAVVDSERVLRGILTDGDFRRAVLNGVKLDSPIEAIMNKNPELLRVHDLSDLRIKQAFTSPKATHFPVVDQNGKLVDIIFEDDFKGKFPQSIRETVPEGTAAVIMAGGQGTRLGPLTKVFPKVLIPVGERPIIELLLERFSRYGVKNFYVSLYHKARMVKLFFDDHISDQHIEFIEENRPLGTAGALGFLKEKMRRPFFVSNCDILLDVDYTQVYDFHVQQKYDLTLVGSVQHHIVPYGVCDIENGGLLKTIREKPAYDLLVNTGVYLLSPGVVEYIDQGQKLDMTELVQKLQADHKKIGVFPISEKAWIDVGQLEEYKRNLNILGV